MSKIWIGDGLGSVEAPRKAMERRMAMGLKVNAFYKFIAIDDVFATRQSVYDACVAGEITGSILVAPEGINGTICGLRESLSAFFAWLRIDPRFADLQLKESPSPGHPFKRLKVKIKPEIVTFQAPDADPSKATGVYVEPEDWNALVQDPNVLLVDTRNAYEIKIGTFEGAIDPGTASFGEFPEFVRNRLDPKDHPRIAMFCTGGIRCEKATSYLMAQGFGEVYQLRGGILKYLEMIPEDESLWRGECFVFDERVALSHGLALGNHILCHCGHPVSRVNAPDWPPADRILCETCVGKRKAAPSLID